MMRDLYSEFLGRTSVQCAMDFDTRPCKGMPLQVLEDVGFFHICNFCLAFILRWVVRLREFILEIIWIFVSFSDPT